MPISWQAIQSKVLDYCSVNAQIMISHETKIWALASVSPRMGLFVIQMCSNSRYSLSRSRRKLCLELLLHK